MKSRERFDKILLACRARIQEEVAALIGRPFQVDEPRFRQLDKEELFAEQSGRQVLAHIRIEGDVQGEGCLLVGIRDAIHIGGALIMLPESELASVIQSEDYTEELADSFGEIANIVCGAITVTFEEQYPKNVRFIRVEQEIVAPLKVITGSEQPIADIPWYVMTVPLHLDGHDLGKLDLVFPALPFGLVDETSQAKTASSPPAAPSQVTPTPDSTAEQVEAVQPVTREAADPGDAEEVGVLARPVADPPTAQADRLQQASRGGGAIKQKKLVDTLLKSCMEKTGEEVSGLLGGSLEIVPEEHAALTKAGFLEQAGGKQIMSRMDVRGERQGEAFLFVDIKTAVYLGGTLIMLPESELEETVRNEEFSDDAHDAYGEITNIMAGVYAAVFEAQYRTKVGFVKTAMESVVPAKVDPDSDAVIPDQGYYLSAGKIRYKGKDLGRLQFLLPIVTLDLQELLAPAEEPAVEGTQAAGLGETTTRTGGGPEREPERLREKNAEAADILIYTDDEREGEQIAAVLRQMGYAPRILHFKDPVSGVIVPRIQLIFLVMREVNEQGFGVAIKISSAGLTVPLVAAGPAWTRTLVLKAVKYGVGDILITPSTPADVQEKIELNLVKRAA